MPETKSESTTVEDDREAYFAGRMSAQEYLSRNLPQHEPTDRSLTEQLRRILSRLSGKPTS